MPHFISWCGFLGAWLLVAGPLDQTVRAVEEQKFEHEKLNQARSRVEEPAPVSAWWPEWVFWATVATMLVVCVGSTRSRVVRRQGRPTVGD